jgi:hypothetical protein
MLLVEVYGFLYILRANGYLPNCLLNPLYLKTHIANGLVISCIMTCCVLLIMSLASNQMAEVGQNAPAPTNNFDMQLGARTRDWEDKTVATKCSKCGKARKTVQVEGTAMAAAVTSAAGKTPLTVENVQEAVVKALATQAPPAAAFAGMHEFERGNGFGLEEHTAFGAIAEGVTADEASLEGVGAGKKDDSGTRRGPSRGPNLVATIQNWGVGIGILSVAMIVMAQLMAYVGNVGTGVVYLFRWVAAITLAGAGCAATLACAAWIPWVFITGLGLPPTAA